jgi:outer membrane biosynthesis protein TonB
VPRDFFKVVEAVVVEDIPLPPPGDPDGDSDDAAPTPKPTPKPKPKPKPATAPAPTSAPPATAEQKAMCLYNFSAKDASQVSMVKGDIMTVAAKQNASKDWTLVTNKGGRGYVPANYIKLM